MGFKTPNVGPIDVLREHLSVNVASFSGTSGFCDFYPYLARVDSTPARGGQAGTVVHLHDSTDYPTNPREDSWQIRLHGTRAATNAGSMT